MKKTVISIITLVSSVLFFSVTIPPVVSEGREETRKEAIEEMQKYTADRIRQERKIEEMKADIRPTEDHQQPTEDTQTAPVVEITTEDVKPQETAPSDPTEEHEKTPIYYNIPLSHDLQDHIRSTCESYNVPFTLALAMVEKESTYNPNAISVDGHDYGLMQIRDINHGWLRKELGVSDFLNPEQNTTCGIRMISEYIEKYEHLNLALMAYNAGEPNAKRMWKKGVYSTSYSRKVLEIKERIERETP